MLTLSSDSPVRQVNPHVLAHSLPQSLCLLFGFLPRSCLLFFQQHADACVWRMHHEDSTSCSVIWLAPIRATIRPGLCDVDVGFVGSVALLKRFGVCLMWKRSSRAWILADCRVFVLRDRLQAHAFHNNGFIASLHQMLSDFLCHLLLGESHLQNGFFDRFAGNLSSQRSQLFHGCLEEM